MLEVSNPKPKQSCWLHWVPFSHLTTSSRATKDFTKLFSQVEKNFSWQNKHIVKIVAIFRKKSPPAFWLMWPENDLASQENCLAPQKLRCALTVNNQSPELSPSKLWVTTEYKSLQKEKQVKSLADCNAGLAEHQQGTHCQQMSRSITIYNHKLKIALLLPGFCFHKTQKLRIQRSHLPCV